MAKTPGICSFNINFVWTIWSLCSFLSKFTPNRILAWQLLHVKCALDQSVTQQLCKSSSEHSWNFENREMAVYMKRRAMYAYRGGGMRNEGILESEKSMRLGKIETGNKLWKGQENAKYILHWGYGCRVKKDWKTKAKSFFSANIWWLNCRAFNAIRGTSAVDHSPNWGHMNIQFSHSNKSFVYSAQIDEKKEKKKATKESWCSASAKWHTKSDLLWSPPVISIKQTATSKHRNQKWNALSSLRTHTCIDTN